MTILDNHPTSVSGELDALVRDVLIDQGYPERVEVCIHTVGADEIRRYNADAFGRDEATDVVSFPLEDLTPGTAPSVDPLGPPLVLGDVFIAPEVVARRAEEQGFDLPSEIALMAVHGVLHLMGYDHREDRAAEAMEMVETRILAGRGMQRR